MVTDTEIETAAATAAPTEAGEERGTPRGNAARRFTISGDAIARATTDLPDREREAIKWLAGYCVAKNISHREVAGQIRKKDGEPYSADSLYQMFTGRRDPEQLLPMVEAIETFRKLKEENTVRLESDYVEHAFARRISEYCEKARRRRKIGLIYGESQIGKTTTLLVHKERYNHGETVYVRMPTKASLAGLMVELALVLNVSTQLKGVQMRRTILGCFDERMLLIVDEAHDGSIAALNFCREIHDRRHCGVIFSGTNVLRQTLTTGPDARNFRQLVLRGMPPLVLPSRLGARELGEFARAYDLGPAPTDDVTTRLTVIDDDGRERVQSVTIAPSELQEQVLARDGLGRWCMILQEARDMAKEKRRAITWGGVIAAWHSFERLSQFEAAKSES
jgi:hypothetical protein